MILQLFYINYTINNMAFFTYWLSLDKTNRKVTHRKNVQRTSLLTPQKNTIDKNDMYHQASLPYILYESLTDFIQIYHWNISVE